MHVYLVRASRNDARKFTSKYLGAMGVKLFIYIVFLAVFLALDTEHAVPFLVSFLVCYAVFTLFEVIAILKHLRRT
jgi:F0F1-type ATP synthase assembly protein I